MDFRSATSGLSKQAIGKKVAAIVAGLHIAFVGYIVWAIISTFTEEPAWGMYWMLLVWLDATLLVICPVALAIIWLTRRDGPSTVPHIIVAPRPKNLVSRVPTHGWMVIGVGVLDGALVVACSLGADLGPAGDQANFQMPLALFGVLGTFAWADAARRFIASI